VWIRHHDQEVAPKFTVTIRAGIVSAQVPAERPLPEEIGQPQVLPLRIVLDVSGSAGRIGIQNTDESTMNGWGISVLDEPKI